MRDIISEINEKLDEVERKEGVRILHVVESGSRAWGFASPDSDYDVRFVYVRPKEEFHAAPPVLFDDLLKTDLPEDLRQAIDELLEAKKRTTEAEANPQMPVIREFIESETAMQKQIADDLEDDHNKDCMCIFPVMKKLRGKWGFDTESWCPTGSEVVKCIGTGVFFTDR